MPIHMEKLDESDMKYLANRIDPAFYDIELDGVGKSKGDFLRRLQIIINDRIDWKVNNYNNKIFIGGEENVNK